MTALFALGLPRPASAVTFDIPDGDVAGLVAAINSANANGVADKIRLADRGTYVLTVPDPLGGSDGPTGLPSITSPIVIDGNDATIQRSTTDGTPDFRILHVAAGGDLTLNRVVVRHGRAVGSLGGPAQDCGGIRLDRNGRLTLNRSSVSNNYASFAGGGICARSDSVLVINKSAVVDNVAVDGGGIFAVNRAAMDVIDSTISGNSADFGGGIFNDNGAVSRIVGSTISGNTATRWGGGIGSFSFGPAPDFGTRLTISDSVVSGNFGGEGGGIFSNTGVAEVTTSIISDNTTGRGGAAITNSRSVFSVNDSCIFENPNTSVFNDAAAPVMDATDNWWGAADGPSGVGSGSGDAVSPNVEYAPFRTSPAPVCAGPPACTIVGTPGNDVLVGTSGNDVICGRGGDDIIYGNKGADVLRGGSGDDRIYGGWGKDSIKGNAGNDRLVGGGGGDTIIGGPGDDVLRGKGGNDRLEGNKGNDSLFGGRGTDSCSGGAGSDTVVSCE